MSKAGRRRSVVWECFQEHPTSAKRRVLCRLCGHDTVANPTRMVRHITKYCPQADDSHKRICSEYESLTVPARRRTSGGAVSGTSTTSSAYLGAVLHSSSGGGAVELERGQQPQLQQHHALHSLAAPSPDAKLRAQAPPRRRQPSQQSQVLRRASGRHELNQILNSPYRQGETLAHRSNTSSSRRESKPQLDRTTADTIREELVLALLTESDATRDPTATPAWSLLENDHFRQALRRLRPEFPVPTVKDARQSVLPKLHTRARTAIDQFLRSASSLTILCSTEIVADHKRTIRWYAVDQDWRCELLTVTPHVATEYPEEIAARIRALLQQIARIACGGQQQQQQHRQQFMLHLCNDSLGAAQLARGLLKRSSLSANATTVTSSLSTIPTPPGMLVGGCMMQQTLLLFRDMLETITCVSLALEKCVEVASFIRNCKPLLRDLRAAITTDSRHSPHHPSLLLEVQTPTPESFQSFVVCVNQVLALKDVIHRVLMLSSGSDTPLLSSGGSYLKSSGRARAFTEVVGDEMFWLCLELARDILKPFACLLVLSDTGHATSSQLLLCWLMLQNTVNFSSLVLENDKENFNMLLVDRIRMFSEDHVFACLIFDPRIHGLSLSAHGKRKARLIIADLGTKLNPAMNRSHLVEQLLKYLNRERPFDEDDSWTMMASMPRLFWLEYLEEMPELATVALAVLGFRSYLMPLEETWWTYAQRHRRRRTSPSQDAMTSGDAAASASDATSSHSSLELEQVKFHFRKAPRSSSDARNASLVKYRKCIADAIPLSLGDGDSSNTDGTALESLVANDNGGGSDGTLLVSDRSADETLPKGGGNQERPLSEDDGNDDDESILTGSSQSRENSLSGADEASLALRQFKYWLQRFDEQEKSLAVDDTVIRDSDGSLQRFDAEWLDLSAETAQRVRVCVDKFVFGREDEDEDDENENEDEDSGTGSGDSEAGNDGRQQEQQDRQQRGGGQEDGDGEPMSHHHQHREHGLGVI